MVTFASQAALVIANARRHREEQRARKDLEGLMDISPVGVVVLDARTGDVTSINREARRIVEELLAPEGQAEQLLDELTFRRADGREVSLTESPLPQALGRGETIRAEEIVLQVPDGRSVNILVNATPVRSEEGGVESVIVTVQEMSPLEKLERLRAEFLGVVSHELRIPLTSIRGSADTLMEASAELDPAEMNQFFKIIREQADHMQDLIGDLLDVARIEMGTLSMNPEPIDLGGVVDDARSRFLSGCGGDRLSIEVPHGPAPGDGGPAAHRPAAGEPAAQRRQELRGVLGHPGDGLPGRPLRCRLRIRRGQRHIGGAAAAPVPEVLPRRDR